MIDPRQVSPISHFGLDMKMLRPALSAQRSLWRGR
jgi:hypothetical protein